MHESSNDPRGAIRRMYARQMGAGDPPPTPLGHPVVSRHEALSERIRGDLRLYGPGVHSPSSAYRLQALYLDFGRVTPALELAEPLLRTLDDPSDAAGFPVRDTRHLAAERQAFGDLAQQDVAHLAQRVMQLSRRSLMTALVVNAHFWNVRLALEIIGGEKPLEGVAVGMCTFVAERRIGRGLGGDLRYYPPLRERHEAFCTDHCRLAIGPRSSEDRTCVPPRSPANCGMLRILEGFRFFASFPDE